LSGLLKSTADGHSQLNGKDLIRLKVAELVVMGGGYPNGRRSWNFWGSSKPEDAAHVIHNWEGPITFIGNDIGKHVLSGGPLMLDGPTTDPVRMAFIYYSYYKPVSSWDPLTLLYAAYGLGNLFTVGNENGGYNHINPDGSNRWVDGPSKQKQRYLRLKVSHAEAASVLDQKYMEGAIKFAKNRPAHQPPAATRYIKHGRGQ
jgi:hypothetical protein